MATFVKTRFGWQAQIARRVGGKTVRKSKTFKYRREAETWAREIEGDIASGTTATDTMGQIFDRYARERSAAKPGRRWEEIRLNLFRRQVINGNPLADFLLGEITRADLVTWRDQRLREVSPATVYREMNLLKHVFTTAVDDWELIPINPIAKVKRPPKGQRRSRRVYPDEIEKISAELGLNEYPWVSDKQITGAAFLFAIETGMRSGEMLNMTLEDVKGPIIHIPKSKNGEARKVPMTPRAQEILSLMPANEKKDKPFPIEPDTRDSRFRAARDRLKIENLHFHDTRHEAITRLAQIIKPLGLARMVGHKNLNELLTYYEQSDEEVTAIISASTSREEIK